LGNQSQGFSAIGSLKDVAEIHTGLSQTALHDLPASPRTTINARMDIRVSYKTQLPKAEIRISPAYLACATRRNLIGKSQ
jgi:hypothetical protein